VAGSAIIRFKESENAEGDPDVERYMVHGHLELRLCVMHLRSATEPTGHLSRGCLAGQTPNHLGNQAQLRVLVDSGFTRIHSARALPGVAAVSWEVIGQESE
jgi:hypothetical protein